ncbi:hypothetical protein SCG7086_AZ_00010 [Chlamydiales bacterium SCGC AG-110-P3]|nr:hypothetical protein SCG7086_AZ_00010 [Chlamydiales bacterium SCGC AG-110-P3]
MMPSGPLDDVFEKLSEMMNFLDEKGENLASGEIPPGVRSQVDTLKNFLAEYNAVTDKAMKDAGGNPSTAMTKEALEGMNKRERALMERFENLKKRSRST